MGNLRSISYNYFNKSPASSCFPERRTINNNTSLNVLLIGVSEEKLRKD